MCAGGVGTRITEINVDKPEFEERLVLVQGRKPELGNVRLKA
jgi:hypothetical protein